MPAERGERRVGLDLGGTAIKAGSVGADGAIVAERSARTELAAGPRAVLATMAELFRELGGGPSVGVGVPGLLERESGVLTDSPNLPGFAGLAVRDELARLTGLAPEAVRIENDANAAALGEQWLGGARGHDDVLVVTLGTGVGGGLVLGGELFVGAGLACEVGHVVIDPAGPRCGCGSRGCLETFASAGAAERRALAAGLPPEAPGDLVRLAEKARAGSAAEARLLDGIGLDLGRGLGPVVCLLDLDFFVFGGGFSAALDTLERGIRAGIDERSFGGRGRKVRLVEATLGASAGWIGAARLAF